MKDKAKVSKRADVALIFDISGYISDPLSLILFPGFSIQDSEK